MPAGVGPVTPTQPRHRTGVLATVRGAVHVQTLASGATASSKGAQPVCRLPLAAFHLWTSNVLLRRPAAVIQYETH